MTVTARQIRASKRGSTVNILLVDDHALFREGMRHLLKLLDASVHVCEAADARAALDLLRDAGRLRYRPARPGLAGRQAIRSLAESRRLQPQVPVVVLSSSQERFEIEPSMSLGAQAYVFKSSTSGSMLSALRRVMKGEVVFPELPHAQGPLEAPAEPLTERQVQVLQMLSRGLCNKEIADLLGVAENTVKVHLGHIYRALGVSSRTAALLKALETGLLEEP